MTAITPDLAAPGPVHIASPWAGRIIGLVFAATVLLFLIALMTLRPRASCCARSAEPSPP